MTFYSNNAKGMSFDWQMRFMWVDFKGKMAFGSIYHNVGRMHCCGSAM